MTKKEAVQKMVEGFQALPTEWAQIVAEEKEEDIPYPMWGTMWRVVEPLDVEKIKRLLRTIAYDDEDAPEEVWGLQEVGETGIFAWEVDGELLLGINGAGYDFYEAHWTPLYEALGYKWHE